MTYESLLADCYGVMKSVLTFLGKEVPDEELMDVVENSKFDKMKKRDLNFVPGCPSFWAKQLMKDSNRHFLREGKSGSWRNHLSVANNETIEKYLDEDKQFRSKIVKLNIM